MNLEFKELPPASILAFTGHRPQRLGGFEAPVLHRLTELATEVLNVMKPDKVITGMALGWDMAVATAAVATKTTFIAAIPFAGQEDVWAGYQKLQYRTLLEQAETVTIVSPGEYSAKKLLDRNLWMCDQSTHLAALWDGVSGGGTFHCLGYAKHCRIPTINLWDKYVELTLKTA